MSEQLLVRLTKTEQLKRNVYLHDDTQVTIKLNRFRQRVFVGYKKTDRK